MIRSFFNSGLWGCLFLLTACSAESPFESDWQDYLRGLENTLDRQVVTVDARPFPHYPKTRQLQLQFSRVDINLLEFLRLRRCALSQTLSERNSILGKHGDAAAQLLFDLAFLEQLPACLDQLDDEADSDLKQALRSAQKIKTRELPARIFAASLGAAEFRALWTKPTKDAGYPPESSDIAIAALARWQQWQSDWLAGDWQSQPKAVLETLGEIRQGLGGALLEHQRLANAHLNEATTLIMKRVTGRPLCLSDSPTPKARHFQSVLNREFAGRIQRRASAVNRHQQALMEAIRGIEAGLFGAMTQRGIAPPGEYHAWAGARDTLLYSTQEQHRLHVKAAAALLNQCGLAPGN